MLMEYLLTGLARVGDEPPALACVAEVLVVPGDGESAPPSSSPQARMAGVTARTHTAKSSRSGIRAPGGGCNRSVASTPVWRKKSIKPKERCGLATHRPVSDTVKPCHRRSAAAYESTTNSRAADRHSSLFTGTRRAALRTGWPPAGSTS